jgi:hypothetical protein
MKLIILCLLCLTTSPVWAQAGDRAKELSLQDAIAQSTLSSKAQIISFLAGKSSEPQNLPPFVCPKENLIPFFESIAKECLEKITESQANFYLCKQVSKMQISCATPDPNASDNRPFYRAWAVYESLNAKLIHRLDLVWERERSKLTDKDKIYAFRFYWNQELDNEAITGGTSDDTEKCRLSRDRFKCDFLELRAKDMVFSAGISCKNGVPDYDVTRALRECPRKIDHLSVDSSECAAIREHIGYCKVAHAYQVDPSLTLWQKDAAEIWDPTVVLNETKKKEFYDRIWGSYSQHLFKLDSLIRGTSQLPDAAYLLDFIEKQKGLSYTFEKRQRECNRTTKGHSSSCDKSVENAEEYRQYMKDKINCDDARLTRLEEACERPQTSVDRQLCFRGSDLAQMRAYCTQVHHPIKVFRNVIIYHIMLLFSE